MTGVDLTHNPEFTTCEFYMAYADLEELITMTERLFEGLASLARTSRSEGFQPLGPLNQDFTTPFQRLKFIPAIESAINQPLPDLTSQTATAKIVTLLDNLSIPRPRTITLPTLLDKLSTHILEPQCKTPTFITHHPECLSPLSKSFLDPATKQRVSARAELFVNGREIANMYEEENSPFEQRRKFLEQCALRESDDDNDDGSIDEGYVEALEWGLPPTGGWGCGIDRLCMLFAGTGRIADVLSFGTLRNVVALHKGSGP